ncbi:DNA-methyltransferase [Halomarina litorea]|uniref:DNA-methyltransferase n=1 Tax=Halomarina litorea TaxID=2961595 RepID=UPI0020C551A2|nr:site-specific DNA-methyltransferase [Halomarina sp. BCD28]
MQTAHAVHIADAREMALPEGSVDLVVTSPPYPMISMWDDLFRDLDPAVGDALDAGDGERAFSLMHDCLAPVWDGVVDALAPGGLVCVNVGDATRSLGEFELFPNHVELTRRLRDRGLSQLPGLQWRKPVNRATKFMGSGMLPPNAYPTLEHEHLLVFRKGGPRQMEPGADERYEAAYFWEERNEWFSDLWEFGGVGQRLGDGEGALSPETRERSGAFPLRLPLRLIRMFSTYGDRVLDPFWGTGTTTLAAMLAARDSVGYELDADLVGAFDERIADLPERSVDRAVARLERHVAFAEGREDLSYEAEHYDFPVMTRQERRIRPRVVEAVESTEAGYACEHAPVEF